MKKLALIKDNTDLWEIYYPIFQKHNIDVTLLDIFKIEDQNRLLNEYWDGFFWRAKHNPNIRDLAKKFINLFENKLKIKTFPTWDDYSIYDDKIAQYFLFKKLNISTPNTFIFYNKEEALNFAESYKSYPLISKASTGAGSFNVRLIKNKRVAKSHIKRAFTKGIETFFKEDLQKKYVYLQEFLKDNKGDFRIVCFGNDRIFGFYRENGKKNKFASGSGLVSFPKIPEEILRLVYDAHVKIGSPDCMSYDILKDNNNNWTIGEISVIYGDRKSLPNYEAAYNYQIKDGAFIEKDDFPDVSEYFIEQLLQKWNWI